MVILLRHTHVDMREGIGHLAPGNCVEEVNLSSRGVEQAKRNQERVLQYIRDHRSSSNLVMNTHDLNISNIVLEPSMAMGDFFVLQPNGRISMSSARSEW